MSTDTHKFGIRPYDLLERMAGGLEGRAMAMNDLATALEVIQREFEYDGKPLADELVARAAEFEKWFDGVFITEGAELTEDAQCSMCGGEGAYNKGGSVDGIQRVTCEDCNGSGIYRRET